LPDWLAVIEQVPAVRDVTVLPETEQTVAEVELKVTGSPELAVADNPAVAPTDCPGTTAKLIVCAFRETVIHFVIPGAAA
jgi:hypothetical protein